MPFVPDTPSNTSGKFKPDAADPTDDFRLGPGASSVVRPLAKAVGSTLTAFGHGEIDATDQQGKQVKIPSLEKEFDDFLDRYTTKPTSTLGKAGEEVGTVVAGALMPGGAEAKGVKALESGAAHVAETVKGAALREATRWGFKVAPEDMEHPSLVGRTTSYVAGRSIGRAVSRDNAERFDELARNWLGMPKDTHLSDESFDEVRSNAGKAYDRLANTGSADTTGMRADIVKMGSELTDLEKAMPGTVSPSVLAELNRIKGAMTHDQIDAGAMIKAIRFHRAEATRNFSAKQDPEKWYSAVFHRQAADILENSLEQHAQKLGDPQLISDFRNARKLIARSYAAQDATNTATGHINAEVLANLSKRLPLDGEGKAIADFAKAHKRSAQSVDRIGSVEAQSKLRFFLAAGAFLSGHPGYAGALAGEGAATALGASKLSQRGASGSAQRGLNLPMAGVAGAEQAEAGMQ